MILFLTSFLLSPIFLQKYSFLFIKAIVISVLVGGHLTGIITSFSQNPAFLKDFAPSQKKVAKQRQLRIKISTKNEFAIFFAIGFNPFKLNLF
jgi:hypothetical protein